jgi:hypothetical protein
MPDTWFRFPSAFGPEPCSVPSQAFEALCVLWGVISLAIVVSSFVFSISRKAVVARRMLLSNIPSALAASVLFLGSAASPLGFAQSLAPGPWVCFGVWASTLYYSMLAKIFLMSSFTTKTLPAATEEEGQIVTIPQDQLDSFFIGLAAMWMTLFLVCWAILVPVSLAPGGVRWTDRGSDRVLYKDFWVAMGCFCHPLATVSIIAIPVRINLRFIWYIDEVQRNAAKNLHDRVAKQEEMAKFRRKLMVGAMLGVLVSIPTQALWFSIALVDESRLGMMWILPFVFVAFGWTYNMYVYAVFAPSVKAATSWCSACRAIVVVSGTTGADASSVRQTQIQVKSSSNSKDGSDGHR